MAGRSRSRHCSSKTSLSPASPMRFNQPLSRFVWIRLCLIIAVGVSMYLAYLSLSGSSAVGCGPDSGCDQVLQSKWSRWFGVPVSLFSILAYGSLLVLTFRLRPKADPAAQRATWRLIIPISVLVLLSVLYFAGLQWFVLHRTCPLCMTV